MADLVLIVWLGGSRVAVPAAEVEAVVELEAIVPAPRAAAHVAGLSALRSRVLTVIDGEAALEFARSGSAERHNAIVVPSAGHPYAILLDDVEDVVEASGAVAPVKAPLGAGWDRVALGTIEVEGVPLLLVDPHRLIAGPAAAAAA